MAEDTKPYSSPFRNSVGQRYLKGLFYEELGIDKSSALYTLKDQDHKGFVSLYRLYMECGDLTEYRFAMKYLDGWEHWEMLSSSEWFSQYISRWRRELELRIRSEALATIISVARATEAPNSYYANKYLLEGSWKPAGEKRAGRPTKVAIQQEAHRIASKAQQEASDLERVLAN